MRLLIINPNTTHEVTDRVAEAARLALAPDTVIVAATGRFGARYISSRASFAVAGHAALDAYAEHGAGCDAVLLACFGDPGLDALREAAPVPVIGLVEAACAEAGHGGRRFAIVTGGERWAPMLDEMIRTRGCGGNLTGIHTVAPTGGEIAANPGKALGLLAEACRESARRDGSEAVILGGAGLLGLAAEVERLAGVRVICSVEAGFRAVRTPPEQAGRAFAGTVPSPTMGLSPALAGLFERGRLQSP